MSIENLKKLLATGERLLAEPHTNTLGFGKVDCGTYACFLGWYVRDHGHRDELLKTSGDRSVGLYMSSQSVDAHFNVDTNESDQLFAEVCSLNDQREDECDERPLDELADEPGPEAYVELGRRVEYLRKLIASREQP